MKVDIPKFCLGFYEASDLILPLPPTAGVYRRKVSWDYGLFNLCNQWQRPLRVYFQLKKDGQLYEIYAQLRRKAIIMIFACI